MQDQDYPEGKEVGRWAQVRLPDRRGGRSVKAILFIPEGETVEDVELDIQVVSVDQASFTFIADRRC